jgi:DNA-binding protein H-NS
MPFLLFNKVIIDMTRNSTTSQIAKLQKQLELLKKREAALSKSKQSKALAKIVQLAKESGLTAEDVVGALKTGKAAKVAKGAPKKTARKNPSAGKTVAPKYRNPANPAQTWTGRGKSPTWVAEMKAAGTLDSALIPA